jgi:hypothetical protein
MRRASRNQSARPMAYLACYTFARPHVQAGAALSSARRRLQQSRNFSLLRLLRARSLQASMRLRSCDAAWNAR